MTASHSSTDMLNTIRSRRIPALLTTASSRPHVSSARRIRDAAPSGSLMSSKCGDGLAARRGDLVGHLRRRAGIRRRAVPLRRRGRSPRPCALLGEQQRLAASDPRPAPVITATLPSSIPMGPPELRSTGAAERYPNRRRAVREPSHRLAFHYWSERAGESPCFRSGPRRPQSVRDDLGRAGGFVLIPFTRGRPLSRVPAAIRASGGHWGFLQGERPPEGFGPPFEYRSSRGRDASCVVRGFAQHSSSPSWRSSSGASFRARARLVQAHHRDGGPAGGARSTANDIGMGDPDLPPVGRHIDRKTYFALRPADRYVPRRAVPPRLQRTPGGDPAASSDSLRTAVRPVRRGRPSARADPERPDPSAEHPVNGRVTAIAVDPTDANVVYVGTAKGGV